MTATELIAQVSGIVQDTSYTSADILSLINQGRGEIAAEVDLPKLQASATVTTTDDASTVALPTDYHKGLFWVGSVAYQCRIGRKKGDYHNLLTFMERYSTLDEVGQIVAVCVDGDNLLYQGMDDDSLLLKYYKEIETIVAAPTGTQITGPVELPSHLHSPLLVSYCCREIYSEIEDGIEGQKVNTMYWDAKFNRAMNSLKRYVSESLPRETKHVRDVEYGE